MIDSSVLKNHISEKTILVSIMFGNNEVGTIQTISEISNICNEHNILFHTDAVQAVGKVPLDVKKLGIDLLSISSHKLYGPKGIGALYIKNGVDVDPVILGGGQEHGLRSGTENVASIVGVGRACEKEGLWAVCPCATIRMITVVSILLCSTAVDLICRPPSSRKLNGTILAKILNG